MSTPTTTTTTTSLPKLFYLLLIISSIIFLFHGNTISAQDDTTNIGAIININSSIGKQEKLSMEIAVQIFNDKPNNKHKISLYVSDSGGYPLQAASAADKLIKEKQAQVIIGMDTWKEAELVTEITTRTQVPTLTFSAPSITPSLTKVRWPFLVRMATNDSLQMQCIASIVGSYGWRRVIAIYEDGGYNTADSGSHTLLSNQLQAVGSEIEHWLAFPSFSTLPDPKDYINKEFEKLTSSKQSRVFIIVGSSLELAIQILTGAKHNGLMENDSVWITTDCVTSQLDTLNSSVMSFMQGIIGIKTHFSKTNPSFINFSTKFRNIFRSTYPEEEKTEPGIYALRAYDTISTISLAIEKSSTNLADNILSTNFNGLTGKVEFKDGELSRATTYEIVNVGEKFCVPLKLWSPDIGFSNYSLNERSTTQERNTNGGGVIGGHGEPMQVLGKQVYWPGGLKRTPLGWVMPSKSKPMRIGIPVNGLEMFVKVMDREKVKNGEEEPEGFCIDLFKEALLLLNYDLPHKFVPFDEPYEKLVDKVYLKEVDAIVGDITILANRSNYVEFTQPYTESDLTMIVPVKKQERDWLFSRPFTGPMWLVLGIVFMYTMFVVWFLEHRHNPELFKGPLKNQLSTAMWFTFSTLFFAHKGSIRSNFTQVVLVVWLFVVFVVTASYEASLTSMLTVQRREPTVTDIDTLRRGNATVGCDGDSFIWNYLEQVLLFNRNNIKNISSEYDYPEEFKSERIQAAFLEQPYARVLLPLYGNDYQVTGPTYRLGGFGFVFPKGSPMARDFSKAFLNLSENGTLNALDRRWFKPFEECSTLQCATEYKSLSLSNFWSIFMLTGLTSAIMLIVYIACLRKKSCRPSVAALSTTTQEVEIVMSTDGDFLSKHNTPGHPQLPTVPEIEMPKTYFGSSDSQTRPLRLAKSLAALRRPVYGNYDQDHIPHST
ncbi:Glutamate receptor [Thalictrum thalictroides]|uniref:Glutamate receptor n=1 Tax=Thalictrum thalictroides TaxID=46969 RepID=A0A7J6XHJ0_THATH|nr:Glutamate receptor [Thalictrum thalictroides]